MTPRVWVSKIFFNDGTTVEIDKDDIVVFVGPNNAGKSQSLKDLSTLLRYHNGGTPIIKNINISIEGTETELYSHLSMFSTVSGDGPNLNFQGLGFSVNKWEVSSTLSNLQNGLGSLFSFFARILNTEERLAVIQPPSNIQLTVQPPQHPIHFMQKDDTIEHTFSGYFRQAFGTDLIVHRNAGNQVPLYIGQRPSLKPGEDRLSMSYIQEIEKLDLLTSQGDGMKSFVGVILYAFISHYSILFIDEPEAFLHPPQAKLLGKMLAKDLPSARQLFLTTHSEDFLKGLLDTRSQNLKIIRIERNGVVNKISTLTNSDIKSVWADSLLRHSNILAGLFHSKVVICESDSDCRFFSAVIDAKYDKSGKMTPDLLFIHCGGKHRVPVVVKALKKLNVPILVVSDFDILNDIKPLKDIFEDLGGTWSEIEKDWKIVKTGIDSKRPELPTNEVKKEIDAIVSTITQTIFPDKAINDIKAVLKKASAWTEAKTVGKAFVPSGEATRAFDRLQVALKTKGLIVLEVGELEGFDKSVSNHGPKWVAEVLQKDLATASELESARKFVEQLTN